MQELKRDVWHGKVLEFIEELKAKEMLSEEAQQRIDSLLEEGRVTKAGIIAVDHRSRRQTFTD